MYRYTAGLFATFQIQSRTLSYCTDTVHSRNLATVQIHSRTLHYSDRYSIAHSRIPRYCTDTQQDNSLLLQILYTAGRLAIVLMHCTTPCYCTSHGIKKIIWNGHGYRQSHWVRLTVTVCILFCVQWESA
jgi:hypothetical protein